MANHDHLLFRPERPTTRLTTPPSEPERPNGAEESPFPPTPPSIVSQRPPTVPNSRPQSRTGSRAASPFVGGSANQTLAKTATIKRARAMSNQASQLPAHLQPAALALGKHSREVREGSVTSDASGMLASPKKKRRVDDVEEEHMEVEGTPETPAVQVEMEVETEIITTRATILDKGKEPENPVPEEVQVATSSRSAGRALSQPPRTTRAASRGPSEGPATGPAPRRRTRAGSADPNPTVIAAARNSARNGFSRPLTTVREADAGTSAPAPSNHVILEPGSRTFTPQELVSLEITQPPPPPPQQAPARERFINYPLPGEAVKELKPLTHFDSGSEFLGTESKQKYQTDWHEGTVFDDPWDSETIAQRQRLVAEGGLPPPGPMEPPPEQMEPLTMLDAGSVMEPEGSTISPPRHFGGMIDGMEMGAGLYD